MKKNNYFQILVKKICESLLQVNHQKVINRKIWDRTIKRYGKIKYWWRNVHRKMGAFFIRFVTFSSNHVVCLASGANIFFPLWGGEVPTPDRNWYGFPFPFWGGGIPTLVRNLFYYFFTLLLLGSACAYVPGSIRMT